MSEQIKDGGPAFPVSTSSEVSDECGPYGHQDSNSTWQFPGMTLRDYFAAKAMQGDCSRVEWEKSNLDDLTSWAYKVADAMLKAREVQP